jgi:hypothetical protein
MRAAGDGIDSDRSPCGSRQRRFVHRVPHTTIAEIAAAETGQSQDEPARAPLVNRTEKCARRVATQPIPREPEATARAS